MSAYPGFMNSTSSDSSRGGSPAFGDDASTMSMDIMGSNALRPAARNDTTSEEDQRLHNVGVAALAAVAQYPHAVNEESSSLLMSEVVNAMTGSARPPNPSTSRSFQDESHLFSNVGRTNYAAQFDPESVPVEPAIFSPRTDSDVSDLNLDINVQQLIERTAPWQTMATLESNYLSQDDDMSRDMGLTYEPLFEGNHSSPSTIPDDELADLIRFYPGEEEFYHQRHAPYTRAGSPMMDEVNLDAFYATVSYNATDPNLPQAPVNPGAVPFPLGDDQLEAALHPETIVHTTSMFQPGFAYIYGSTDRYSLRTKSYN